MPHAYEKTPDVIYAEIARLRFPDWDISGAGSIAVVLQCAHKVILCSWPLEAQAKRGDKCSAGCYHTAGSNWHVIKILDQPEPKPPINIRNRALLERD